MTINTLAEPSGLALADARRAAPVTTGATVLVLDDTHLYREGLAHALRNVPWITSVAAASDIGSAIQWMEQLRPDVVVLNMATHNSYEIVKSLTARNATVVSVGLSETEEDVLRCAEAGAAAYLLRPQSLGELAEVLRGVTRREALCSPRMTAALLRHVAALAAYRDSSTAVVSRLTKREREILALVEHGMSNKEIAQELSIGVRTVKNHVHNLLGKLEVRGRGEAAALVRRVR